MRRLTTLFLSEFLEEHAEELGVVERSRKTQMPALVWSFVFGFATGAGFVVISGDVFDVVEGKFVVSGGCDSCAGISAGSLEPLITVPVDVFFATERFDAGRVDALDQLFEEDRFDVLLDEKLSEYGERHHFVVVDANREPHVDCGVYGEPLEWIPEVTPSLRELVTTEL